MPEATFTPRIVILPLQYACDARCVMCNIWERQEKRHWEEAELRGVLGHRVLAEHVQVVNVTGGEPTLRPDFLELMRAVTDSLRVLRVLSLQTNGMAPDRLARRLPPFIDHIRGLVDAGRTIHLDVNISLDGPGGVHDLVRGVPGAYDAVTQSVSMVRKLLRLLPHSNVMFNCTIVRQNVDHLREVQRCAEELGVEVSFTIPQQTEVYLGNMRTTWRFELDAADRATVAEFLRERLEHASGRAAMSRRYCLMLLGLLENGQRTIGCPLAEGGLFLEPGGRALPCWRAEALVAGNILTDGVDAVLAARDGVAYREKLHEHCRTCSINCYVDWARRSFALQASARA